MIGAFLALAGSMRSFNLIVPSLLCGSLLFASCGSRKSDGDTGPDESEPGELAALAPARAVSEGRFATSLVCADCHENSPEAEAMRDERGNEIGAFDLWQSSMMANSARDPLWRAAVSAEVASIPSRKADIESTCMTCHSPMATTEAKLNNEEPIQLTLLYADTQRSQLALDGVSCTSCHQVADTGLGTPASFSGNFVVTDERKIYGPHADPFSMPMMRMVDYQPAQGAQISKSALCGSCHTLHTKALRTDGSETGETLPEQAPYLEWRNSAFSTEVANPGPEAADCQTCHVPITSEAGVVISTALAHRPDGFDFGQIGPRSPYSRHIFIGGNTLIPQILRDNREALQPIASTAAFNATIALTRKQLREKTADITIAGAAAVGGRLMGDIRIGNATGHKFPSAHPSRRVWLHLRVTDSAGGVVFESGRYDSAGRLVDEANTPLPSELAGGPYLAHSDVLSTEEAPLVYEVVMADTDGEVTYRLLQGARYIKDNRLLPRGWSAAAVTDDIKSVGVNDDDFVGGSDHVRFDVDVSKSAGPYAVTATLLYQPLSARYAAELFTANTPEVRSFRSMYERADRTPERVVTASIAVP